MFLTAPYRNNEEFICINIDNVVMAQPRLGKVGQPGEKKGVNYTSFLMTSHIGISPTLDTLLEWEKFTEMIMPFDSQWIPK